MEQGCFSQRAVEDVVAFLEDSLTDSEVG